MIGIIFQFGAETIEVRIQENSILFRTSPLSGFVNIDRIKLNKNGVIREFPDLKDNEDWQKIGRERFKEKIKKMETEREKADYIINDLKKYGYVPLYEQRQGFRPKKLK